MNKHSILVIDSIIFFILSIMAYLEIKENYIINMIAINLLMALLFILHTKIKYKTSKLGLGLISLISLEVIVFIITLLDEKEYIMMVTVMVGLAIIIYITINYLENIRDE